MKDQTQQDEAFQVPNQGSEKRHDYKRTEKEYCSFRQFEDLLGAHVFGTMLGADITKRIKSS